MPLDKSWLVANTLLYSWQLLRHQADNHLTDYQGNCFYNPPHKTYRDAHRPNPSHLLGNVTQIDWWITH